MKNQRNLNIDSKQLTDDIKLPNEEIKNILMNNYYTKSIQDIENSDVDMYHLENIFTDKTYYLAMKIIPLLERKVLYLTYIENVRLNDICRRLKLHMEPNIILDFCSIYGDIILVDIDKKLREFQSITQEDIMWYTRDLMNKVPVSSNTSNMKQCINKSATSTTKKIPPYPDKCFEGYTNTALSVNGVNVTNNIQTNFETELISVLTNIELVLASILKNTDVRKDA